MGKWQETWRERRVQMAGWLGNIIDSRLGTTVNWANPEGMGFREVSCVGLDGLWCVGLRCVGLGVLAFGVLDFDFFLEFLVEPCGGREQPSPWGPGCPFAVFFSAFEEFFTSWADER